MKITMIASRDRSGAKLICICLSWNQCLRGRSEGGLQERTRPPKSRRCIPHRKERCHPSALRDNERWQTTTTEAFWSRADQHFASVMRTQPQNLQCGAGCSLCCYGLFEIGSGDVPMIAEGLEKLHPSRREEDHPPRAGDRRVQRAPEPPRVLARGEGSVLRAHAVDALPEPRRRRACA